MIVAAITVMLGLALSMVAGSRTTIIVIVLTRSFADPLLGFTQFGGGMGAGGGLNLLVIMLGLGAFLRSPHQALPASFLIWAPVFLFFLPCVVMSPLRDDAVRWYLTIASNACMFVLPFYYVKSEDDLRFFLKLIIFSSVIPVLAAFVLPGDATEEGIRASGTFPHPNIFGFYLVLVIFACAFLIQQCRDRQVTKFVTIYLPFLLLALFLTKTRSAWGACALIAVVYGFKFDKRFLVALVLGGILLAMTPGVAERFSDLSQGNINEDYAQLNSFAWRKLLWASALEWSENQRIFGYGAGSFRVYMPVFFPLPTDANMDAHSSYVQLIFEGGYVAISGYVMHLLALLSALYVYRDRGKKVWILAATCTLAYAIVSFSDNVLQYLSFNWYFYFTMGSVIAYGVVMRRERQRSAAEVRIYGLLAPPRPQPPGEGVVSS